LLLGVVCVLTHNICTVDSWVPLAVGLSGVHVLGQEFLGVSDGTPRPLSADVKLPAQEWEVALHGNPLVLNTTHLFTFLDPLEVHKVVIVIPSDVRRDSDNATGLWTIELYSGELLTYTPLEPSGAGVDGDGGISDDGDNNSDGGDGGGSDDPSQPGSPAADTTAHSLQRVMETLVDSWTAGDASNSACQSADKLNTSSLMAEWQRGQSSWLCAVRSPPRAHTSSDQDTAWRREGSQASVANVSVSIGELDVETHILALMFDRVHLMWEREPAKLKAYLRHVVDALLPMLERVVESGSAGHGGASSGSKDKHASSVDVRAAKAAPEPVDVHRREVVSSDEIVQAINSARKKVRHCLGRVR
jgi:hypothetical protein